jgi:hypothetical protein
MQVAVILYGHMQLHYGFAPIPEDAFDECHLGPVGAAIGEAHRDVFPRDLVVAR